MLDEPFAGFGHLLVFLLRLQEFAWTADPDRAREGVDMLENRSIRRTGMRSRAWGSKEISVGLYVPLLG